MLKNEGTFFYMINVRQVNSVFQAIVQNFLIKDWHTLCYIKYKKGKHDHVPNTKLVFNSL